MPVHYQGRVGKSSLFYIDIITDQSFMIYLIAYSSGEIKPSPISQSGVRATADTNWINVVKLIEHK